MIPELELLHFALWHTRAEIVRHATAESCILSTRLLSQVYAHMGVRSMPIVVGVTAGNKRWRELAQRGEDPTDVEGAFGVQIRHTYEDNPEAWCNNADTPWPGGHIVLVAQGRYLCDPSADQLSYPDRGLVVPPMSADLGEHAQGFIEGDLPLGFRMEDGGEVIYHPFSDDLSYTYSTDWKECKPGEMLFDRVFEQVVGLVEIVQEAGQLPESGSLPTAVRSRDKQTPEFWRQLVRSGVELDQIEATPAGIVGFLKTAGVPQEIANEVYNSAEVTRLLRRAA